MIEAIKKELSKSVIGQERMIDALLIGLLSDGHILLEGVPGLAKTTTVNALSKVLDLDFKRVQFTPDLLPSDIIGAEIYDMTTNSFKIKKGPVFTNLLLADEINRAPAKVQSALLEVMQEKQVTIGDESFAIAPPFLVLATQNPIEQEGAYELPEAQLDRFMLKTVIGYNTKEEELLIAKKVANSDFESLHKILGPDKLLQMKKEVKQVHIDEEVEKYIIDLIFATRDEKYARYLQYGASPRASIDLYKAAKAFSYINGLDYVSPVEIAAVFKDVLRHRIVLSFEALAKATDPDSVLETIIQDVAIP
ncbi:MAG: AAA family ATPase [Campylobacterota bacterium]